MPQVDGAVRKDRASRLRAAGADAASRFLRGRIGSTAMVLVEKDGIGRTEQFAEIRIDRTAEPGSLLPAAITDVDGDRLVGRVLEAAA
jgi:threonylcarbamoyladenosine tRNA methylthiotransferase MtaB